MKTQRIKKVSVLLIALLMIAGTNLYAQRGRNNSNQGKGFGQNQACMMLPDLTDDQQSKIESLRVAHLKEKNTHQNQMNELRAKKQTLMSSDNADLKEINSIIDQMTALHGNMMKSSAKHQQEVRNLLTDEQKVYFDSRPMRGHGRGMGNGDGYDKGGRRGAGQGRGYGQGLNPNCPYNTVNN